MTGPQEESTRWVVHGEWPIYENRWVSVGLADVSQPSGERFEHHTVTLPAAAMTVVLDDAGEHVLLAWRHRFVTDVWSWELPGGVLDDDETPAETAVREVAEETGYRVGPVEHLVTFEPLIGTVRSAQHVFVARGAEWIADSAELNEGTFDWVALADVRELIAKGRIVDAGSLIGLLRVLAG